MKTRQSILKVLETL